MTNSINNILQELRDDESSHSSLISDTLIEQLQGKGNTNRNQLLATVKFSRSDRNQSLQKGELQDNPNNKSNVHTLNNIKEESPIDRERLRSFHQIGQVSSPSISKHDISQGKNGQGQHQKRVDIEIPQELDKQHPSTLKQEGSKTNHHISGNFVGQHQERLDTEIPQEPSDEINRHSSTLKQEGSKANNNISGDFVGQHQKRLNTGIPQKPSDEVKRHSSTLKQEGSKANHNISENFLGQSEKRQNQIDRTNSKQQADSKNLDDIEAMDKSQRRTSYSHIDNELPVKENSRLASNARNESLGVVTSKRSSSGSFDRFVEQIGHENNANSSRRSSRNSQSRNSMAKDESLGATSTKRYPFGNLDESAEDMEDGNNENSSRRSSRNFELRSSVENVIDDERQYGDSSGYRRYSNQEYRTQCDDDCYGRCRNQTIQTGPASILKHHPSSSGRSLDFNQTNYGEHRDTPCPSMRVVSDQTTNAPTSGYSIYNILCDCQNHIMTSNKKLQTSETNLTGNNVRYYCTNSTQSSSNQTVALQDTRGDTNISQSRKPTVHTECRCCPETRKKSAPGYQCSQATLTEYEQLPSRCPQSKCDGLGTYSNREGSDHQEPPTDYTSSGCRCCPTNRSRAIYKAKYQQAVVAEYQQSHMESGGQSGHRYCVQGTYSDEPESPQYCQPCPGYASKRRTSRSITCNPSLTPRSIRCSTRYSPSDVGDFDDEYVAPPSPRRRNRRCSQPAPLDQQPVQYRMMPSPESPPWSSPDYRKSNTKCICSCCCRGDPSPPPPPLPDFFCCPDEEEELSNETSDISDDECFCDDLGSPAGLSYQDNEEYQELLTELEEALACRNRNRVRRAIQEFEHRSRLNKPLERPIIDYDETSGSEGPLIEKLSQLRNSRKAGRHRAARGRRSKSRGENEYPREEYSKQCSSRRQFQTGPKREGSRLSKWKMDEAGEWYKSPRALKRCSRSSSPRKDYHNDICTCCACNACVIGANK